MVLGIQLLLKLYYNSLGKHLLL